MDRKDYLTKITEEDKYLIKLFQEEVDRINLLYLKAIHSNDITKANQLLKQIRKINNHLAQEYGKRAEVRLPQEYVKGSSYIDNVIEADSISIQNLTNEVVQSYLDELGPVHIEAVNALVDNSKNYVKASLDGMERQALTMLNELQQTQAREQLAKGIISGDSVGSSNERLVDYFTSQGISGFKDRGGKYWSIDRYVDMLTRTETAIANTQGTINRALELGITKFGIVERPDCCEVCAEMNGDIVDIRDGVVELPPFHPNCRGYIYAVMEEEEYLIGGNADLELNDDYHNFYLPENVRKKFGEIEKLTTYNDLKEYLSKQGIELTTDLKKLSEEMANEEIDVVKKTAQNIAVGIETYKEVFGEDSLKNLKKINLYDNEETSKAAYYYNRIGENDINAGTIKFRERGDSGHEVFHELAHVYQDSKALKGEDALTFSDRIVRENSINFKSSYGVFGEGENAEMIAEAISQGFTKNRADGRDIIIQLRKPKK